MNKKVILGAMLVLLIGVGVYFYKTQNTVNIQQSFDENAKSAKEKVGQLVTINIDFGEGDMLNFEQEYEEQLSAYTLLLYATGAKDIPIDIEQYGSGVFVKSINNSESAGDHAWFYYVNGTSGDVAADQKMISPGDFVEWKYQELDENI